MSTSELVRPEWMFGGKTYCVQGGITAPVCQSWGQRAKVHRQVSVGLYTRGRQNPGGLRAGIGIEYNLEYLVYRTCRILETKTLLSSSTQSFLEGTDEDKSDGLNHPPGKRRGHVQREAYSNRQQRLQKYQRIHPHD